MTVAVSDDNLQLWKQNFSRSKFRIILLYVSGQNNMLLKQGYAVFFLKYRKVYVWIQK